MTKSFINRYTPAPLKQIVKNFLGISALQARLEALNSRLDNLATKLAAQPSHADVDVKIEALSRAIDGQIHPLAVAIDGQIQALAVSIDGQIQALAVAIDKQLTAMNSRLDNLPSHAALDAKLQALSGGVDRQLQARDALINEFGALLKEYGRKQLKTLISALDQEHDHAAVMQLVLDLPKKELAGLLESWKQIMSNGSWPFVEAWKPGSFYSPIPSMDEVRGDEDRIFNRELRELPGIDMRDAEQLELLGELAKFQSEMPYKPDVPPGLRYKYPNPSFNIEDSILLYSMLRHLRPRRVIEVGCGYTSGLMLDTNEIFFDRQIEFTFIEPYPEPYFESDIIRSKDREIARVLRSPVQHVPVETFESLESNDILFVDCSHVSKVGSDVNYLIHDVFPRLRVGVHVHIHDVPYPFEYWKDWVFRGWAWNEAYLLRAFLEFNSSFEVVFFNDYMGRFHKKEIQAAWPLYRGGTGGDRGGPGSVWIRRVR